MTARAERGQRFWVRPLLAAVVAVPLAAMVLRVNLPMALAGGPGSDRIAALFPHSPSANREAAALARDQGKPELMAAHAKAALALAPIDQRSVSLLAATSGAERQRALLGQAAALGWRDQLTQLLLMQAAAAGGDPALFAQRLDASARQAVAVADFAPFIDTQIARPAFRAAVAARLALNPVWRPFYIGAPVKPDAIAARLALLDALAAHKAPPNREEVRNLVLQLRAANEFGAAQRVWRSFAAAPRAWSGVLYDGGFRQVGAAAEAIAYEWNVPDGASGYAGLETADGVAVLHAHQSSGGAQAVLVQVLTAGPGNYRLTGRTAPGTPALSRSGFSWTLQCTRGAGLAASARPIEAPDGRFAISWSIPAGCDEPVLTLGGTSADGEADLRLLGVRMDKVAG